MITIIITSYKEPRTIAKAIDSFLQQDIKEEYEIIVVAPDKATLEVARKYAKKYRQVKLFQDEGRGKSTALNSLLPRIKGRIIILTDGDVYVSQNSVNRILEQFEDSRVGCVSGQVKSQNSKSDLFGYWSHVLCYSANKLRESRNSKNQFLECSGYLWAFRNNIIKKFPKDVAEDTIVPILFYLKSYKIKYAREAEVYVKFPDNLKEFIEQKKRTAKSHESISLYVNNIPRMKTFSNELAGSLLVLGYASNFKEFVYGLTLFPFRLYIWLLAFYHKYIKKDYYQDNWKRIESEK